MDSKYVLPESIVLKLNGGDIAFGWVARAWDEFYHRLIVIEFPGRTPMYGEWTAKHADSGYDFDIEILGFGYRDGYTVGSPNLSDRLTSSPNERALAESLIRSLFLIPLQDQQ